MLKGNLDLVILVALVAAREWDPDKLSKWELKNGAQLPYYYSLLRRADPS